MSELKSTTSTKTADFLRENGRKNWIDAQIRGDKFTTFVWRGKNSWVDYNCFITSDKKGLTWSNYGSIKNDYSSTMFGVNKTLLGTTVENKSITMNLCLYDVTMAQYEEFLVWLNPQILGRLYIGMKPATDPTVGYSNNWFYKAKIGSIGDSTVNYLGQDKYIIELKVVFETQDNYAYREETIRATTSDVWELKCANFRSSFNIIVNNAIVNDAIVNAQPSIFIIKTSLDTSSLNSVENVDWEEIVNITLTQSTSFEYSSAEGLLYDTSKGEPLSLLTSNEGKRVLKSMLVKKKFVPAVLEDGASGYSLYLNITGSAIQTTGDNPTQITVYRQDKCLIPMGQILTSSTQGGTN